jgi:hypothetical protein
MSVEDIQQWLEVPCFAAFASMPITNLLAEDAPEFQEKTMFRNGQGNWLCICSEESLRAEQTISREESQWLSATASPPQIARKRACPQPADVPNFNADFNVESLDGSCHWISKSCEG